MEKKSFNRRDLAEFLAKKEGLSIFKADSLIRTTIDGIINLLVNNREPDSMLTLNLPHFGSFKVKKAKPRKGRNPRTGETVEIPAYFKVLFQPGKEFKGKVKEGKCD